ncbi:MAG: hypothetical protein R3A46_21410 [Thermomicrobiales bacterium]
MFQTVVASLLTATLILSACSGGSDSDDGIPNATPATATSSAAGAPEEANIGTGSALVWPGEGYSVVLVHGAIYDAASWSDQAKAIAAHGFAVVAVEHATADDVRAASDYLRRTFGISHVALVGASAGAGPVIDVVRGRSPDEQPEVDLMIILAGSGEVQGIAVPSVLFIAADGDAGAARAAERMMSATSGKTEDLVIVPGSAHAQALFSEPEGEVVLAAILNRLDARRAALGMEP